MTGATAHRIALDPLPVELPWPAKALSPNHRSRSHWPRTNALRAARHTAWVLALKAGWGHQPLREERDLIITFYPPGHYHYDRDNLIASTKAYQDGLADALGCDDHTFRPAYRFADPIKGGKIVVEIGEMF